MSQLQWDTDEQDESRSGKHTSVLKVASQKPLDVCITLWYHLGYDYFEVFCQRHHTEIVVMNGEAMSPEQELVRDLLAIVTVFGARLRGLRS